MPTEVYDFAGFPPSSAVVSCSTWRRDLAVHHSSLTIVDGHGKEICCLMSSLRRGGEKSSVAMRPYVQANRFNGVQRFAIFRECRTDRSGREN
jgi:hypothetical protein